jgi:hypothetical protein
MRSDKSGSSTKDKVQSHAPCRISLYSREPCALLAIQVEMHDGATPMTWERFTGNWRGSYQGWLNTTKTFGMRMSKILPGLENFTMAGQWVEPGGGLPLAYYSRRFVQ